LLMKKIIIAIDGYSATGKSSTAKKVASKLGYTYIDSGAMYRAVTYFFIKNGIDYLNTEELSVSLNECDIHLEGNEIFLNGEKVNDVLRTMEVNQNVSPVSTISSVREKLVEQQREMGKAKGVVMDGRDIGTIVFPDAELKLFMTADVQIRAQRRKEELERKNLKGSIEEIIKNLGERDHIDSTRADSPLVQASDAIEIDTSYMTLNQQIEKIVQLAEEIIYDN
ncbi:cytidylate kinase, partial [Ochromonadaceae sp. CCMP2298]